MICKRVENKNTTGEYYAIKEKPVLRLDSVLCPHTNFEYAGVNKKCYVFRHNPLGMRTFRTIHTYSLSDALKYGRLFK